MFLDRDGVLIEDEGYIFKLENMHIRKSIFPLLKAAQARNYLLIIISNQSGIARGYFTEKDFWSFQNALVEELKKEGIYIKQSYFCPFLKNAPIKEYDKDSNLRKPAPGMVLRARKDFNLDLSKSLMIGDKESDMLENIEGLQTFILKGKYPVNETLPLYNNEQEILKELGWG